MSEAILPFTGERFTPECVREIAYEHWHRYAFALSLVEGKQVLDAACGEGFGAALLASKAGSVVAIDIDAASIEHAMQRYNLQDNLGFRLDDVTQLDSLPDESFDVIVSFETLEHVMEHDRMLAGFSRLLKDDGILLVSTPDKKNYSDATGVENPHHVRELYFSEFSELLDRHFSAKKIYTQKLLFQSSLSALDGQGLPEVLVQTDQGIVRGMAYPPMYYVAVCAKRTEALMALPGLSLYGDAEESVYAHYNKEVRYNMWARQRVYELEMQLAGLEMRLAEQESAIEDIDLEAIEPEVGLPGIEASEAGLDMPAIELATDSPELEGPQADIEIRFIEIESDFLEMEPPQTAQKPADE